ncbi:MAG: hypothetical protein U9M97_00110 [Candidatus Hadarchaeota archaeon]|nr:hypothetical protein [Candidatus Hadarchaeota archaeon]
MICSAVGLSIPIPDFKKIFLPKNVLTTTKQKGANTFGALSPEWLKESKILPKWGRSEKTIMLKTPNVPDIAEKAILSEKDLESSVLGKKTTYG